MKCKFFVSLFAMAFFFVACAQNNSNNQSTSPETVSAAKFKEAIAKPNVQILDVRTAGEYQSGHIQNALQANWLNEAEFVERVQFIDKNKPVLVYCASGVRSEEAMNWVQALIGFTGRKACVGGLLSRM